MYLIYEWNDSPIHGSIVLTKQGWNKAFVTKKSAQNYAKTNLAFQWTIISCESM